ncbi:uncharacterized protein BX663DRAFT_436087 [Cokeromyces recurvatus]|uniref:uncharacterized protein n=1 Tax=Cokeromyces recurvatus TaxID=90255 RepID=UPI00221FD8AA|nr:uncharacterized protein BX663DRAFT_436087 [Cokeromyces recurvatus]KAI7902199.1 hypothetical protein BX663DRAFT_436087 [Cokeromyces recurvatus]
MYLCRSFFFLFFLGEAAARINAMLAQKGIPLDEKSVSKADGEFVKDITINDLKNRYMLTRGATQTQIQQETGADVITRGKYYPDVSLATDKEPPLYLHITASTKESLDKAVKKIQELIETTQVPTLATGIFNKDEKPDAHKRKFFEKRLPVDIQGTPHFNLRAKIVGPNGAFVKHIQQETGCRVQLKGRGSGFYEASTGVESDEPLHVHISCLREEGLEAGIKLTQDLLDTVKAEAERGPPQNYGYVRGAYPAPARGGYNGYSSPYNGYSQPSTTATSTPNSDASGSTPGGYDYEAYNNYYSSYYGQGYQQYDPNSYYNYYGYSSTDSTATPPPPPAASTTADSSNSTTAATAAIPPPPPPPSSATTPPPPPPPPSSSN